LIMNLDGGTGGDNAIPAPSLGSDEARVLDNGGQRRVGTRHNAMRMFAGSDDLARIFEPHRFARKVDTMGTLAFRLDKAISGVDDCDGTAFTRNAGRLPTFRYDVATVGDR